MRCQACDYELWHCTGRRCPECGTQFSLAEFEFEGNAVLFHCPHCDHGIEGESLDDKSLMNLNHCTKCGLEVNHETVVVRPKPGVDVSSFGSLLPIRLKKGNWISKYFSTVLLVMTRPQTAISRVPVQEPLWIAWKFLLTTFLITVIASSLPMAALLVVGRSGGTSSIGALEILTFISMQFVIGVLVFALYAISWALCAHVLLQITGGSTFTIRRTTQAVLYGGAASIVGIIPCIGAVASSIWWLVATTNMITRGQRVHGGRATFATIAGPFMLFVFVCGGYILLMYAVTAPLTASVRAAAKQKQLQLQQQPEVETPAEEQIIE